ncbi:Zn-dependent oxidoreductase [Egibacter rhizosphaerae]|uniref:Zn-dependent oxidoreductase n=1 Tax=Egibacter rhizosphaerae TaxID=1670831 RepID=A0A411YKJ1_9ACTN|nr:zinc-binding dehydrogenase [Egibacter rhizosphaerae]QBI21700.1 Zn-dependent oxidoreductase [Egibacter rhizosphaerae]
MRAAIATHGSHDDPLGALEVRDHPEPDPPDGWEVVHVRAASLNHHDVATLRGIATSPDNLPIVLGTDAAGVTEDGREVVCHAVAPKPGTDVPGSGPHDETDVFGRFCLLSEIFDGTHAERVAVPHGNLLAKPPELSFAQAACLPTAWLTAYRMLFVKGGARPGQSVLVQGAGGGVATAAIVLGHAAGLRVHVASRHEDKRARALELGAVNAVEPGGRLTERVDVVIETVGEATFDHSLKALAAGGAVVVAGATTGPNPPAALHRVFAKQLRVLGSTMGTRDEFEALIGLLAASGARPVIDATYGLEDATTAYRRMVDGDLFGKAVLLP